MGWRFLVLSGVPLTGTGRSLDKLSRSKDLICCQLRCCCQALVIEVKILFLEVLAPPKGDVLDHEAGTRFVLIKDVVWR